MFNDSALQNARTTLYQDLWAELHTEKKPAQLWFNQWSAKVPWFGCSCGAFLSEFVKNSPPRFDDWFRWTWELHDAVDKHINKPTVTIDEAIRIWRPPAPSSPRVNGCKIVTAFSPKRLDRQRDCLESWLRSGFDVIALQTTQELIWARKAFVGVEWVEENDVTDCYDFDTQKIRNLLGQSKDEPVFLLNSDIEMCEKNGLDRFKDSLKASRPTFYLRWNYSGRDMASEFKWGLDGLLIWPEDLASIPKDLPCGIGHAMWDYVVPYLLKTHGRGFTIDHYPWLMHENHPQNWSDHSWHVGFDWLLKQGYHVDYEAFRKGSYRRSMDPEFVYSVADGKWVEKHGP